MIKKLICARVVQVCITAAVLLLSLPRSDAYTLLTEDPTLPGITLRWKSKAISYYINPDGSGLSIDQVKPAIQAAFDSWTAVTGIQFRFVDTTTAKDAVDNQNTIFWDKNGAFVSPKLALARTQPHWNSEGAIYDVDIGFATGTVGTFGVFSPPPESGCPNNDAARVGGVPLVWNIGEQGIFGIKWLTSTYKADVQATATHEIGHFLGLDHSAVPHASMSTVDGATPSFFCNTDQRTLKTDDLSGVTTLYPNQPPTAGFVMSSGLLTANDGQVLTVPVPTNAQATVTFDSTTRSSDPDGDQIVRIWTIDNFAPVFPRGTPSVLEESFVKGTTHVVSLVVVDSYGARSAPVQGTVVVTEINQPPTAGFSMSAQGKTAAQNQTLNLTVSPGDVQVVSFDGTPPKSSDPDGDAITSYEWRSNGTRIPDSTFGGGIMQFGFGVGTHVITLVVTDGRGERSTATEATIVVSELSFAPQCILSASPSTITQGQSSMLSWSLVGAPTSGSIDNGIGNIDLSKSMIFVAPTATTTYTMTVGNSDGNNTCHTTIAVNSQATASFVYAPSRFGITGYKIDDSDGSLSPLAGSPFPDPACNGTVCTSWVATDPLGHFLYVTEPSIGSVSVFSISSTGTLTYIPGSTLLVGGIVSSIIVHPSGRFAYTTNADTGRVLSFAIDSFTGKLTPLGSPWFLPDTYAFSFAFDPSGRFLYVGARGIAFGFSVNQATGLLTPIGAVPGGERVSVHPNGLLLYTGGEYTFGRGYAIDPVTGALTVIGSVIYADGRGQEIDPTGRFLYTSTGPTGSGIQDSVYGYSIDTSSGNLSILPGLPIPAGLHSGFTALDPSGRFLYVVNTHAESSNISAYTIDAGTGKLTPIAGAPYPNAGGPITIARPQP